VVVVLTAVMTVLVLVFADPLLRLFGATETILPYARDYLLVVGVGFVFSGLSMALSSLLQAEGNAQASMKALILGAVLNTILDPVFIFVFPMGVAGAALATVISQVASLGYILALYLRRKTHVRVLRPHLRPDRQLLTESAALGVPSLVQNAGMSVLMIIVNQSLRYYGGDDAITVYGMAFRLMSLAFLPMFGLVQGFQPVAGYNFGAQNYRRVRQALVAATALAFGTMAVVWTAFQAFPALAMGLFTSDTALAQRAGQVLSTMGLFLPLVGVQVVGSVYFQAVGKAGPSIVLGLLRQFLFLIPLLVILPLFWGLEGVWWAYPLSDLAATIVTIVAVGFEVSHLNDRHDAERVRAEGPAA